MKTYYEEDMDKESLTWELSTISERSSNNNKKIFEGQEDNGKYRYTLSDVDRNYMGSESNKLLKGFLSDQPLSFLVSNNWTNKGLSHENLAAGMALNAMRVGMTTEETILKSRASIESGLQIGEQLLKKVSKDSDGNDATDFWSGVGNTFKNVFSSLKNSLLHPVETGKELLGYAVGSKLAYNLAMGMNAESTIKINSKYSKFNVDSLGNWIKQYSGSSSDISFTITHKLIRMPGDKTLKEKLDKLITELAPSEGGLEEIKDIQKSMNKDEYIKKSIEDLNTAGSNGKSDSVKDPFEENNDYFTKTSGTILVEKAPHGWGTYESDKDGNFFFKRLAQTGLLEIDTQDIHKNLPVPGYLSLRYGDKYIHNLLCSNFSFSVSQERTPDDDYLYVVLTIGLIPGFKYTGESIKTIVNNENYITREIFKEKLEE